METVKRVQSIASNTLDDIPAEFIRSEQERPINTTSASPAPEIPTIDLSNPDRQILVQAIANASQEWGIFQVINHGIPDLVIEKLQRVGREFFELPQEEKEIYANKPENGVEGYGGKIHKEVKGAMPWVDHFFHNIWPPSVINYNVWPKNPPSYKECNEEYAKSMQGLTNELLVLLSLGLGLEGGVLKEAVGGEDLEYLLKINYYPPCPRPDLALGVPPHTDMSVITVLLTNGIPGLQIFEEDQWFDAKHVHGAFIVHIGDQAQILSNGKYKNVLHRSTLSKEKMRMSWPIFISPPAEKVIGPLPQFVDENNPPMFKSKKYKDYAYCKLNRLPQ